MTCLPGFFFEPWREVGKALAVKDERLDADLVLGALDMLRGARPGDVQGPSRVGAIEA